MRGNHILLPSTVLQPRHPLLHPLLADVGINLRRGEALVAQQRLDVHPFGPGVQEVGGVSMPQFIWGNLFFDAGLLEHPPQIGAAPVGTLLCLLEISAQFLALTVATCNRKRLNLQSTPFSDRNYLQLTGVQTGIICN